MNETFASKLFDAWDQYHELEGVLYEYFDRWLGEDAYLEATHDYYDESCEAKGVAIAVSLSHDALEALWAMGFKRCWLCHEDGTQKYYTAPNVPTDVDGQ